MTLNTIQSNQLVHASSPYLLQHANNPVHWQEWNEETLTTAQAMNKPILLSIGYAACHWCHVMAHESFEDEATAELMNTYFVNIKVDREERPDIDQIYMAALHALGEQGGWPLTMFLKPDSSPFWGGTYFPPMPAHGRPAFKQVLESIHNAFEKQSDDVDKNAHALTQHLNTLSKPKPEAGMPDSQTLSDFSEKVLGLYDQRYGGMKGAPKFPNAPFMEVWARAAKANPESNHAKAFIHSIREISLGGIYDHLAGGIARYSVDDKWLVPHFEKMLYDNAHYIRHLVLCWQLTSETLFRVRIEETIQWLESEMLLKEGPFASSLDADSEGEEGKFYVWQDHELATLIPDQTIRKDFFEAYDITANGNWEGKNILNLSNNSNFDVTFSDEFQIIGNIILDYRNKRIRPGQDDKILTDWNAYLIRALTEASIACENQHWLKLAQNAYRFITESNSRELFHSSREENTIRPALTTDYAAMLNAALSLYESTKNNAYLKDCKAWFEILDKDYTDEQGGYYLTSINASDLLVRPRADQDEANPSASSLILEAMIRYANLSGETDFHNKAGGLVKNLEAVSKANRYGMAGYMNGLDSYLNHVHVLVCGEDNAKRKELQTVAQSIPIVAKTISVQDLDKTTSYNGISLPDTGTKPCVIICSRQTCSAPIHDAAKLKDYFLH